MKDTVPKQKSDLFFYTEDWDERKKRSKPYFSGCEQFAPQEQAYFTYNDFLYWLTK